MQEIASLFCMLNVGTNCIGSWHQYVMSCSKNPENINNTMFSVRVGYLLKSRQELAMVPLERQKPEG